jgi:hypothetical protein
MNTYDTAHMLHHLRQWQSAMQAAEQRLDELSELTGINPEAPLFESLYGLMGLATRQAADLTGASLEWLEPWWLEHAFGARPMQAGLHGEPLRTLGTIEELVQLIADDLTASEQETQHANVS